MRNNSYFYRFINETVKNTQIKEDIFVNVQIIGIGAVILNGLSYMQPEGNLSILANWEVQNGFDSGLYRYIYVPGYNRDIGFNNQSGIPTAERAICDLIKYKELFHPELYSAMSCYLDETENLSKLYTTAKELGISEATLQDVIDGSRNIDVY